MYRKLIKPRADADHVWRTYNSDAAIAFCYVCEKIINRHNFESVRVISQRVGGGVEVENLRPTCITCCGEIGRKNMMDYIKEKGIKRCPLINEIDMVKRLTDKYGIIDEWVNSLMFHSDKKQRDQKNEKTNEGKSGKQNEEIHVPPELKNIVTYSPETKYFLSLVQKMLKGEDTFVILYGSDTNNILDLFVTGFKDKIKLVQLVTGPNHNTLREHTNTTIYHAEGYPTFDCVASFQNKYLNLIQIVPIGKIAGEILKFKDILPEILMVRRIKNAEQPEFNAEMTRYYKSYLNVKEQFFRGNIVVTKNFSDFIRMSDFKKLFKTFYETNYSDFHVPRGKLEKFLKSQILPGLKCSSVAVTGVRLRPNLDTFVDDIKILKDAIPADAVLVSGYYQWYGIKYGIPRDLQFKEIEVVRKKLSENSNIPD